jgi:hypothetical protein
VPHGVDVERDKLPRAVKGTGGRSTVSKPIVPGNTMRYDKYYWIRFVIAVVVGAYAIYVVQWFAGDAAPTHPRIRIAHVVFWTLAPPVWFFLEYWMVDRGWITLSSGDDKGAFLASLKTYADQAGKIWAAVLAVILLLYPRGGR